MTHIATAIERRRRAGETAEEIAAEIDDGTDAPLAALTESLVEDLRSLRATCGEEYAELDLGGYIRRDGTSGHWISPDADHHLAVLAILAGSRSQAVRCWLAPAVEAAEIDVRIRS